MGQHPIRLSKKADTERHSVILSDLVDMNDHQSILKEVKTTIGMMFPEFDFGIIENVFEDIIALFSGDYPGYKKCNTEYHDLRHTLDTFLAMARLLHGAHVRGLAIDKKHTVLGLVSSLMHDTGYIQHLDDLDGTGGKYTLTHIRRSIEFMSKYFNEKGYSQEDFKKCSDALQCTGLNTRISGIEFDTKEDALMGKMVGTADLLGQMADRIYLEKLLFLFLEMKEANVQDFDNEFDLLSKTMEFHRITKDRFASQLDNVNSFMKDHFKARWDIENDLYLQAVENQMKYLKYIIENNSTDYRSMLRRGGVVKKLNKTKMKIHHSKS